MSLRPSSVGLLNTALIIYFQQFKQNIKISTPAPWNLCMVPTRHFNPSLKQATLCHPLVSGAFNVLPVMSPSLFFNNPPNPLVPLLCLLSSLNLQSLSVQLSIKIFPSPYGLLLWLIGRGVRERIPHFPLHDPAIFPPRLKGVTPQWGNPS